MLLSDFNFLLPESQIAQRPLAERDSSRMLILDRPDHAWKDESFSSFPDQLRGDELIVVNNARVIPARLFGRRVGVHAEKPGHSPRTVREFLSSEIEVLLTRRLNTPALSGGEPTPDDTDDNTQEWEALVRPGRKMRVGEKVEFGEGELSAEVVSRGDYGLRHIRLTAKDDVNQAIERLGHIPLPPYIARDDEPADHERYQTIFADRAKGHAVAAPTAGLHFSPAILEKLRRRNIEIVAVTLDVGLGTFQPIHEEEIERHKIHSEHYEISEPAAAAICNARRDGRPILAIGTTVVRTLEDAAAKAALKHAGRNSGSLIEPSSAEASIFIKPGHKFLVVDQVLTNFHLPQSTLLVLVSAFAGRELILSAYRHAVEASYRFYSYGDCMWIR
jgi:S-adenosylmethionine:tRNA ribosyltransferase-isomerase